MLGLSIIVVTADTYTSVLPEVARKEMERRRPEMVALREGHAQEEEENQAAAMADPPERVESHYERFTAKERQSSTGTDCSASSTVSRGS